jgi:hypothetical protein
MSSFDSSSVITYSTLHNISLGARSSNDPLQVYGVGTTSPFNAIPYSGGHIPPPSPSLRGAFQLSIGPNTNYSWFSGGSHGPQSYMTLVGSIPFYLFVVFGNNAFSSPSLSTRGNPMFGQQNPTQGFDFFAGRNDGSLLLTRSWKSLERLISFTRDVDQGKPLPHSVKPQEGFNTYSRRIGWGNPQPRSLECYTGRNPYTRNAIQLWESYSNAESNTSPFYWTTPPWSLPKPW